MKAVLKTTVQDLNKSKIEEFTKKYVEGRFLIESEYIYKRINENRIKILDSLNLKFNDLCRKACIFQEKNLKRDIKYIYISYLRSSLFDENALYRIDLYDEKWFLDKSECYVEINFNFIFDRLFEHLKELREKKKEYGNRISEIDIERIMFSEGDKYHQLAVKILGDFVNEMIKCEDFKNMKKCNEVMIYAGEFRAESRILLKLKEK